MGDGARLVKILTPPDVDPQGAATLWTNLVALLRPAWRRFLGGQPHLGFELTASDGGLTIALWVPGQIPPGLVERAVEAAWPGARTETVPAAPPLVGDGIATGGALALALPEHYPLRTEHKVDPLRPLIGALAGLGETESACVQILARPVTGRRLTRLHKAAAARRAGRPATRLARLVDLATPGPAAQPAANDPSRGADVADILDKAAQPCWAIAVRYAVATTATDRQAKRRPAAGPSARRRLRVRAVLRAQPPRPPPAPPPRPGPRRPPARPGQPGLGRRAGRPGPSAHRPGRARPGPSRGQRRRPTSRRLPTRCHRGGSARHDRSTRPSCSATPRPAGAAPSPWRYPTPATTSTSWGPPGRASRRCSPTWSSATSKPAGAWWSSTPKAT